MRQKHKRWALLWTASCFFHVAISRDLADTNDHSRGISVPRMDYDQWKPMGRGDPLKNDPTYDYVPPVLDRVHYWVDPAQRKPDSPVAGETQKTEILLLGVSSKKPATGSSSSISRKDGGNSRKAIYEPFNYAENQHYNSNQRVARPSMFSSVPALFSSLFSGTSKERYPDRTAYSKGTEEKVPYTVLMPPPLVNDNILPHTNTGKPSTFKTFGTTIVPSSSSTVPSVTVQSSDLVYHSSSSSNEQDLKNKNEYPTLVSSINWEIHSTTKRPIPDFREKLVYNTNLTPPETSAANFASETKFLEAADSNHNINYVTPPPLVKPEVKEFMFKGHVSDDDDMSNKYVNIRKPEAEIHSTPLQSVVPSNMIVFPQHPLTMQTIKDMQTMQPPPKSTVPSNPILTILKKEKTESTMNLTPLATTNVLANDANTTTAITTTTETPATTVSSLTTDPLFKHYKQAVEPIKGPLYLIIQGHSRVKTYGPTKQIHGIPVQETNEIPRLYDGPEFEVKHLHGFRDDAVEEETPRKSRSGDLQTLKHVIQTGLGAIDFSGLDNRRQDDVQEAELETGYKVLDRQYVAEEKYHKGIVEAARKLKE